MTAILPLAFTIGLLLIGSAALFAALMVTRRTRQNLEHRVSLVAGMVALESHEKLSSAPLHTSLLSAATPIRRVFSIGTSHQWGMQANGLLLVLVAIVTAVAVWLLAHTAIHLSYWIAVPATIGGFFLAPRALLQRQQSRSEQQFMVLFPDAIDMAIRMLRAGLPITAATRAIGNEAPAPVNMVFRSLADQVDIGIPFEEALASAGEKIGLPDFRFFAVAISLQRATGGNLAATLDTLAEIIRKRRTVRLQAQATTGEIRMSAYILGALPFLVTGAMLLVSPGYLAPLITDPRGNVIAGLALLGLMLAYLSMRHMLHSVTMA